MQHLWTYGASPINWCNDDMLDLGDNYTLAQILGDMRRLGFRGTELGRKFPRDAERLGALLRGYGLALVSGWSQVHLADRRLWPEELAAYEQHVKFLRDLGASVVVTAEGSGSVHWDRGGDRPRRIEWTNDDWRAVQEGLDRAGQICADYGLQLVYHPHLGTNIESRPEVVRLLDNTHAEWVSLVVDTGHLSVMGIDPAGLIRQYPDRVRHVHMKSVRPAMMSQYHAGRSFLSAVRAGLFTVPGDGLVNFAPIVKALQAIEFRAWCIIEAEQDPAVAEPNQYMRLALDYLAGLSAEGPSA
ncbi:MAG: myo-inosose-2 dehydratase [Thermaerobacter sp.]|nr:myo-inosose-2 dehydratase [Thermaerobacter sp.]